jgi:hypothetical protein
MKEQEKHNHHGHPIKWESVTEEHVSLSLKTAQSWNRSGADKMFNFWLKHLTVTHKYLAESF